MKEDLIGIVQKRNAERVRNSRLLDEVESAKDRRRRSNILGGCGLVSVIMAIIGSGIISGSGSYVGDGIVIAGIGVAIVGILIGEGGEG